MKAFSLRCIGAMAAAVLFIAGCIAGGMGTRVLESLSISPGTVTAGGSSAQFTATGYWSAAPTMETPIAANWGACTTDSVPTSDVTVSTSGQATCSSGAKGTYMVFAWDPQYGYTGPVCTAITACGGGCGRVAATAQLTCP